MAKKATILERAKGVPAWTKSKVEASRVDADVILALISGEITDAQLGHVLEIPKGNVASWAWPRLRSAVRDGLLKLTVSK